jgi:hypothetical protein
VTRPNLGNVPKPRLSSEAARQLRRTIREGRYLPEQRLPAERPLSRELGVSRPGLREAPGIGFEDKAELFELFVGLFEGRGNRAG